eukprot:4614794-Amphidinium_carterae.2
MACQQAELKVIERKLTREVVVAAIERQQALKMWQTTSLCQQKNMNAQSMYSRYVVELHKLGQPWFAKLGSLL